MKHCQLKAITQAAFSMCLLSGVLLAGCATPQPMTVEEQVGNRALQWADALMAGDYDGALSFMTPSYQNSPRSDRFRSDFSGAGYWQTAEIKWVKCDDEDGVVNAPNDGSKLSTVDVASDSNNAQDADDGCVVNVWNDCSKSFPGPVSVKSTTSTRSDRCELRLALIVMKPPEISFPMPIPYDQTWLNVDGEWYIYRQ